MDAKQQMQLSGAVRQLVGALAPETQQKVLGLAQLVVAVLSNPAQGTQPGSGVPDPLGEIIRAVMGHAPPPRTR